MLTRSLSAGIGIATAQLLLSLIGHAADWYEVGGFPDKGVKVYIDKATLVVDHETVVSGWTRFEYKQPHEQGGTPLIAQNSLRMANCRDRRYWITEAWGYPPGNAAPVRLYSDAQEWQLAAPDSEGQVALDALCFGAESLLGIVWDKVQSALFFLRMGFGR